MPNSILLNLGSRDTISPDERHDQELRQLVEVAQFDPTYVSMQNRLSLDVAIAGRTSTVRRRRSTTGLSAGPGAAYAPSSFQFRLFSQDARGNRHLLIEFGMTHVESLHHDELA
jgi:hypothetical protein